MNFSVGSAPVPSGSTLKILRQIAFAGVVRLMVVTFSLRSALVLCGVAPTFLRWFPFSRDVRPLGLNFSVRSALGPCGVTPTFLRRLPFAGDGHSGNDNCLVLLELAGIPPLQVSLGRRPAAELNFNSAKKVFPAVQVSRLPVVCE